MADQFNSIEHLGDTSLTPPLHLLSFPSPTPSPTPPQIIPLTSLTK